MGSLGFPFSLARSSPAAWAGPPIRDSTFQQSDTFSEQSSPSYHTPRDWGNMHSYGVHMERPPKRLLQPKERKHAYSVFMIIMPHPSSGGCSCVAVSQSVSVYLRPYPLRRASATNRPTDGEDESVRACYEYRSRKRSIVAAAQQHRTWFGFVWHMAWLWLLYTLYPKQTRVCENMVESKTIQIKVRCIQRGPLKSVT